jgi:hypothetical protein
MDHSDIARDLVNAELNCFSHHYKNNFLFKVFSSQLKAYTKNNDIRSTPVLPNLFFVQGPLGECNKDIEHIKSVPHIEIAYRLIVSVSDHKFGNLRCYPFDTDSMNLSLTGISKSFRYIYDFSPEDYFYFLTPSKKGATEVDKAMKKALSVVTGYGNANHNNIHSIEFSDEEINVFEVVDDIHRLIKKAPKIHIYGSIDYFMRISEEIIRNGINLDLRSGTLALLSEGQNSNIKDKIDMRMVKEKIELAFGIPSHNQRMNYGAMEVMQIFPQCAAGFFHIPPGVILSIRNRKDPFLLEEVPDGEEGQICIINPMIWSFPPFIATEETGMIVTPNKMKCACGKYGPTYRTGEQKGLPAFCCLEHEILNSGLVFVLEDRHKNKPNYSINPQSF